MASTRDLVFFHNISVEFPVKSTLKCVATEDAVRHEFRVRNGVAFEYCHLDATEKVTYQDATRQLDLHWSQADWIHACRRDKSVEREGKPYII